MTNDLNGIRRTLNISDWDKLINDGICSRALHSKAAWFAKKLRGNGFTLYDMRAY